MAEEGWLRTGLIFLCKILGGTHRGAFVSVEYDLPTEQNDELATRVVSGKSLAGKKFWLTKGRADWSQFLD